MNTLTRCVQCKNPNLSIQKKKYNLTISGYKVEAELPAVQCKSCGQTYWDGEAIERFELTAAGWFARQGVYSGEVFKFMRKTLGLKATELAELLDVSVETISRWEQGHRPADRKALSILGSLVLDRNKGEESTLKRLRALHNPPPSTSQVDLTPELVCV
jgi:putative zinc finger/helix-turn-helix YgiT family protein